MTRLFVSILIWTTATIWAQSPSTSSPARTTPFSVRDSIEMTMFSDPFTRTSGATAKEAPDGRGFVVVTTKGHLATNTLESCLWYFSSGEVKSYLKGTGSSAPRPRLLLRKVGVAEAEQNNSYGSLITDVQWSADSRSLRLVVEGLHGVRHPYQVWLAGQPSVDLTAKERGDVAAFTSRSGTSAYLVSMPKGAGHSHQSEISTVITGHGILDTLFPDEFPGAPGIGQAWKLRVQLRGKTFTFPAESDKYFPYVGSKVFTPAISPDGLSVVTLVPVGNVPVSWSAYQSADHTLHFVPSGTTSDRTGRHIDWPWQYAIVDLKRGRTIPLFDAPTAFTTAWGGPWQAKWSRSGTTILLTKTYLPLGHAQQPKYDSVKPCGIAEYEVAVGKVECLAETPSPELGETLVSVDFDAAGALIARWSTRDKQMLRRFDPATHTWTSQDAANPTPHAFDLYVHQDLDLPPTLWVRSGTVKRLIWDPNPQLHGVQLAKASVVKWTDPTGYTWRGGLVLPPTPRPPEGYPLVVQTHGFYNEHEFLVDGAFTTGSAAQPLACAGIAVLQMEDRVGKHFRPADQEADDEVDGIEGAIDGLVKDHIADPSKIGLEGFSRTSWYVEKALEHSPSRYRAAILIDGIDQSYVQDVLFTPGYPSLQSDFESSIGSQPYGKGLMNWFRNATGFNLDKVVAPVRLESLGRTFSILGEWEIYSILQQQGKAVDFIDIPDAQHILQKPQNRYVSQQGAVDWFRYWLQDYRRVNLEARDQYKRWDLLAPLVRKHAADISQ